MEWHLTDKQNILIRMILLSAGIFLVFRFLVPLVLPFLIAGALSIPIGKAAGWVHHRWKIPTGISAIFLLAAAIGGIGGIFYFLGKQVWQQVSMVWENLPSLWQKGCRLLYDGCCRMERAWQLNSGSISNPVMSWIGMAGTGTDGKSGTVLQEETAIWKEPLENFLSTIMNGSVQGAQAVFQGMVGVLITVGATFLSVIQSGEWKKAREQSPFREEIDRVLKVLHQVFLAYGKTQLFIMGMVMAVCAAGLAIMGNRYFVLLGILLGFVDALPVLGVGSILWPWAVICLFRKKVGMAVGLAVLYGICFFLRQWMETHYMGDQIGLSALENLMAMYVGLRLFGFLGLFYGPIGYLLLKEALNQNQKNSRIQPGEGLTEGKRTRP
jgi:sporulation integral membrane protein YtvI